MLNECEAKALKRSSQAKKMRYSLHCHAKYRHAGTNQVRQHFAQGDPRIAALYLLLANVSVYPQGHEASCPDRYSGSSGKLRR